MGLSGCFRCPPNHDKYDLYPRETVHEHTHNINNYIFSDMPINNCVTITISFFEAGYQNWEYITTDTTPRTYHNHTHKATAKKKKKTEKEAKEERKCKRESVRCTSLIATISHDNNNHRTSKHASTSWRSDGSPSCLAGSSHSWVLVKTHSSPVHTSVGRLWVAHQLHNTQQ